MGKEFPNSFQQTQQSISNIKLNEAYELLARHLKMTKSQVKKMSAQELSKPYRQLMLSIHPDRQAAAGYNPEAAQEVSEINAAYELITQHLKS